MKNQRRGFSLLELVLALSFAAIVLYGITSVFTSLTKFEFEAVRKNSVDGWSQASLSSMTKEIEDATIIYFPSAAFAGLSGVSATNGILGCTNWSTMLNNGLNNATSGGPLDPSLPVVQFYYCYDATSGPTPAPSINPVAYLRRIAASGAAVTCPAVGAVNPGTYPCHGGSVLPRQTSNDVIATNVNLTPGNTDMFFYYKSGPAEGVSLNFLVGNPTPGPPGGSQSGVPSAANITNPQTLLVQTSIALNRPYMNSND